MDVANWLHRLGLEQYEAAFAAHGVDFGVLTSLDAEDIREIGITAVGHRRKLIEAIAELRDGDAIAKRAPRPSPGAEPGERRQATVLFADLVGYTRLSTEVDAEVLFAIRSAFSRAADGIAGAHGGATERHIGDSIMAVFGAPVAYGNDAEHAIRAALAIRDAMKGLSENLGRQLDVHIGVASGEVVASGMDGSAGNFTVTGEAVNLASRLTGLAAGGEIVISDALREELGDRLVCKIVDHPPLKGFDSPVRAWRLDSFGDSLRTPARAFVGRRQELRQLASIVEACLESGRGQTVLIRGEAGIGKTRILEQFLQLATSRGFACHGGFVLDFGAGKDGDSTKTLVQSLLGVPEQGDRNDLLTMARDALGMPADDSLGLAALYDLLDLPMSAPLRALYDATDNSTRTHNLRALATRLATVTSRTRPLLLSVEDVHWADNDLLAGISALSEASGESPVIVALTSRLDGDPTTRGWRPDGGFLTIDASPLRPDEAETLARGLLHADAAYASRCVERAAGNPLFLEQLLRNAHEQRDANVPNSVQSLIQARVDRLKPADKHAIQAASIFGQRFSLAALRSLIANATYDPRELVAHFLIRPRGAEFLFEHALIRDAIYATLLKSRRRELHKSAALWFRDGDLALWAEHLDRADDAFAPLAYLAAAREEAAQFRYAKAHALAERGAVLARDNADRFELTCYCADVLYDLGSMEEAKQRYEAALAAACDDRQRCRAWLGLAAVKRIIDDLRGAFHDVDEAQRIADHLGAEPESARAHVLRGNLLFPGGDFAGCLREHQAGLELARKTNSVELAAAALGGLGDAAYMLGRMSSARSYFQQCVDLSDIHGFVRVEVANRPMLAFTRWLSGEAGVLEEGLAAVDGAIKIGNLRAETIAQHGLYLYFHGRLDLDAAYRHIERALTLSIQLKSRRFESEALTFRGDLHRLGGRRDMARKDIAQALTICRETGMTYFGPTVLGLLALAADDACERRDALAEGEALLEVNMIAHNHLLFRRDAIEACLEDADWDEVERHAEALRQVVSDEPNGWVLFLVARAHALAAFGRGERSHSLILELSDLKAASQSLGMNVCAAAIDRALASAERRQCGDDTGSNPVFQ